MSLQIWLPLNGTLENQGLSNAIISASTTPTYINNGKIGKALSGGRIKIDSTTIGSIFNNKACSMAFWYNNSGATGSNHAICGTSGNSQGTNGTEPRQWDFFNYPTKNDFHWSMGSMGNGVLNGIIPDNTWIHFAFVLGDGKFTIYKNGSVIWQGSSNPTFTTYAYDYYINFGYSQYMNDFRIYDHALSAKEVKELSKGLVLHYRLAGHTMLGEPLYTHTDGSHWIKLNHHNNKSATVFFTQANALWNDGEDTFSRLSLLNFIKPNSAGVYEFLSYQSDNNTWRRWTQTSNPLLTTSVTGFTNISNATRGLCKCSANTLLAHTNSTGDWWGAVGCWTAYSGGIPGIGNIVIRGSQDLYIRVDNLIMDDTIEYDCSGYKYNGTKSGTIVFDIDSPRYESSYKVGLTKAYISTPNIAFERMPQGTLNIWINRHSSTSDWRLYACFANGYNWTSSEADFIIIGSTGGTQIYLDCCSNVYSYTSTLNEWHMYTITWDLQQHTSNIYIDGEHVHTTTNAKIDTLYASKHNYHSFGNQISSDVNDYSMSDARIYSTVLSAEDIAELYHSAVIVDNTGKTYAYEYFEAN